MINTTVSAIELIGLLLIFSGITLFLAGASIVTVKQWIEIKPGFKTILFGIVLAVVGTPLLLFDTLNSQQSVSYGLMNTPTPIAALTREEGVTLASSFVASKTISNTQNNLLSTPTVVADTPTSTPTVAMPTATPTLAPTNTPAGVQSQLNSILGEGNWFCMSDRLDAVGIREIPDNMMLNSPIKAIEKNRVLYDANEKIPVGGSGTVWLNTRIQPAECPNPISVISTPETPTKQSITFALSGGSWECLADTPNAVLITGVPAGFTIQAPFSAVDKEGTKYNYGEVVPSGGPATGWLLTTLSRDQCP